MPAQQIYGAPTTYGVEAAPEPGVQPHSSDLQDMVIRPSVLGKSRSKANMVRVVFGLSALDASGWVKTHHLNGAVSSVW